ncbi:protein SCARECROW-like [Abeliophyllum distichum]|uniref:Protein SCARECROW-like n=1 Tax=Abeliophyllum distichum TaxID=126358 RepID=A0ABD1PMT9_9LAMI
MNPHLSWPAVTLLVNASRNSRYLHSNPSALTAILTSVCFTVPATMVTNSNEQVEHKQDGGYCCSLVAAFSLRYHWLRHQCPLALAKETKMALVELAQGVGYVFWER